VEGRSSVGVHDCVCRCLCVEGRSGVGALLTKHARVSSQKGVKLYSARK